ncbi:thioredoxin-dependent thiol peroxidase [Vibrio sp. V33_P6A3T137]|uniref:thioredoxin-dependent thiol peroxidase n=1 Tax=Vibrio sp. V33_P6A3T137 TaxID=1938685 RepID=UPI001372EF9F|nr:thioredoxin-dependent thiol peroxidase [Vibrio sp. V33_P6A3T137]NAW80386.1 thioredoxin-dependent thiol peroxidase [Vibrio sp. V33_P6A3T137]
MTPLHVGSTAPTLTRLDQHGNPISLADFAGKKVLLYFYPKAMTPGCTVQAQGLRDIQAELAAHNVVVLGVSVDPVARLGKFIERDKLNFTLLSDEDHQLADQFGVWGEKKFTLRKFS